jgi:hypothetical protein
MRTVINLANEIEDRTPQEQAAIERMTEALEQNPLFQERSLGRSLDRSLDRGIGKRL